MAQSNKKKLPRNPLSKFKRSNNNNTSVFRSLRGTSLLPPNKLDLLRCSVKTTKNQIPWMEVLYFRKNIIWMIFSATLVCIINFFCSTKSITHWWNKHSTSNVTNYQRTLFSLANCSSRALELSKSAINFASTWEKLWSPMMFWHIPIRSH